MQIITIVINATAARESGALTILRQLTAAIERGRNDMFYIIFVPSGVNFRPTDNIHYVYVDTRSWYNRIAWDEKGLREWLEKHDITPDLIVSLQNTGVNCDRDIPQIIYYHQLLPFESKRWNPLRHNERIYFFYKNVYPFFVRRHLDKTARVIVQRESIKRAFSKKFGFEADKIVVLRPDIVKIDCNAVISHKFKDHYVHMVYPATPLIYKNHDILIDALEILRKRTCIDNLRIHLTFDRDLRIPFVKRLMDRKIDDTFVFEGKLPFEKLLSMYKSASALLFPSYIETFGLPLIEAAAFGLPIVCSDLPYTHEVLGDYSGAKYVTYDDPQQWADAIENVMGMGNGRRFIPIDTDRASDWDTFIELCKGIIRK